ncbi:MAG: diphosphate--fructose-6-phosphate 1-phosphotransferase [Simkaniaceae bacterium]|nr:diphosphate--fructose-6-phosphate 1-phosphotransferase [Simkaniaceae bacterium]
MERTPLHVARLAYLPNVPEVLTRPETVRFSGEGTTGSRGYDERIGYLLPGSYGRPIAKPTSEGGEVRTETKGGYRVGVLFSGGQAAGGHNVLIGLFRTLKRFDAKSRLFGFSGGPSGLIEGRYEELHADLPDAYLNQGGFDLIGSGRTKIETGRQFADVNKTVTSLALDGLVIIGGDDSNTNAALLAEYFIERDIPVTVAGVPKTIDGDLRGEYLPLPFGFDTASKTYAEIIGNIGRDALSADKYTHFIKLMGRSASHIALECALMTRPNHTLIGEETVAKGDTMEMIVEKMADLIERRSASGKNHGVILIPEGLIEFIPEMRALIEELNRVEKVEEDIADTLSSASQHTFRYLPEEIRNQLLLDRDPHGNVRVSHIRTEELLSRLLTLERRKRGGTVPFLPVHHFLGYEGRAAYPSNFDATYCYNLGTVAALLIRNELTGYMGTLYDLHKPTSQWQVAAVPLTSMMTMEVRKGKETPVIGKTLVDLKGEPFRLFAEKRTSWAEEDHYLFPGPIQFAGGSELTDRGPATLYLQPCVG